ncbi:hypothetical protein AB0M58_24715 [Streptomyces bobili]|uniref:hypothetical protein n=1 Tax=Streptomyces bobili TaxID=67280 RepID=UPI003435C46C
MITPPAAPLRVALTNGSFEQPAVTDYEILPDASQTQAAKWVPGWLTTASDHKIELWHSGYTGVPAADGAQFAELNAFEVSTLYQDLPTTPGTKLYWRLYHRGRQVVVGVEGASGLRSVRGQPRSFSRRSRRSPWRPPPTSRSPRSNRPPT